MSNPMKSDNWNKSSCKTLTSCRDSANVSRVEQILSGEVDCERVKFSEDRYSRNSVVICSLVHFVRGPCTRFYVIVEFK